MLVVVIDINGVLGDVRKLAHAVSGRTPDAFLYHSNQVFYWRPGAQAFLQRLKAMSNVHLVLWTSRLRKNAAPIESQLNASRIFTAMLHGEDCFERRDEFHPVKDVRTLRRYYAEVRNATIVFVDNKPQYVSTDTASFVLPCVTYDAAKNLELSEERSVLDRLATQLEELTVQCNSSTATV